MKHRQFEKTIEKILLFLGNKIGFIYFGVFMFSFLFVMFFGNYPQWKDEEYRQALKRFFEPELKNITFDGISTYNPVIKLFFTYSDGSDLSKSNHKRPNRLEISSNWKIEILNLVCVHDELREQLQKGRKIEIDLRDGDSQFKPSIITNMVINNGRC